MMVWDRFVVTLNGKNNHLQWVERYSKENAWIVYVHTSDISTSFISLDRKMSSSSQGNVNLWYWFLAIQINDTWLSKSQKGERMKIRLCAFLQYNLFSFTTHIFVTYHAQTRWWLYRHWTPVADDGSRSGRGQCLDDPGTRPTARPQPSQAGRTPHAPRADTSGAQYGPTCNILKKYFNFSLFCLQLHPSLTNVPKNHALINRYYLLKNDFLIRPSRKEFVNGMCTIFMV